MTAENKTNKELLNELAKLRRRINELETSEAKQRRHKESILEDRLYLKSVMSSIQAGIMLIDAEKHQIVDINKTASELIGDTKGRIIGKVCHEYVCPAEKGKCPITDLNQVIDNSERFLITVGGRKIPIIKTVVPITFKNHKYLLETFIDISERKRIDEEREKIIKQLQSALLEIKTLSGLLPICMHCKKIRDDKGYWNKIEEYISDHSEAQFSHGLCPECAKKLYPDYFDKNS